MRALKNYIKAKIQGSASLSHWVSLLHSKVVGLLAWRHRLAFVGRCHISMAAKITGWSSCYFGSNCVIGARTWINVNSRRAGAHSIYIGDNTFVGQDNFITVGKLIKFGPYCLTASHCSFIGSTHLIDDPFSPYASTGTSDKDSILIGANCFFGYGVTVLGDVTIGHGCILGAKSVVRSDIPPFSLAVGNPAKVVKHFDFARNEWVPGGRSDDNFFQIPSEGEYIKSLSTRGGFLLQPISAASGWLSDI